MPNQPIDFSTSDFPTIVGFPHVTQQTVMPVVAFRDEQVRPLGTCFGISPQGLALTARHVVDEALNLGEWRTTEEVVYDQHWQLGVIYVRDPLPGEGVDLFGGLLPAHKVHLCGDLDMAVIALTLPIYADSGEPLRLPSLRLRPGLPKVGATCIGLGYHSMKATAQPGTMFDIDVYQSYNATRGILEEVHFPLQDQSLRFPCFRTSARFEGGMSGGPIMDPVGNVFGMICSSFGEHEEGGYISYGSLIGPALLMQIEATVPSGEYEKVFLHDFVIGGAVAVDDTIQDLKFVRNGPQLTIDFGVMPTISNILKPG